MGQFPWNWKLNKIIWFTLQVAFVNILPWLSLRWDDLITGIGELEVTLQHFTSKSKEAQKAKRTFQIYPSRVLFDGDSLGCYTNPWTASFSKVCVGQGASTTLKPSAFVRQKLDAAVRLTYLLSQHIHREFLFTFWFSSNLQVVENYSQFFRV